MSLPKYLLVDSHLHLGSSMSADSAEVVPIPSCEVCKPLATLSLVINRPWVGDHALDQERLSGKGPIKVPVDEWIRGSGEGGTDKREKCTRLLRFASNCASRLRDREDVVSICCTNRKQSL